MDHLDTAAQRVASRTQGDAQASTALSEYRDKQATAAERLMDTAAMLFNANGIRATGIDTILAEAGVARMTLYRHYSSKEGLIRAVLKRESASWLSCLNQELGSFEGAAEEKLDAYFNLLERWFKQPDFKGCSFINAVAEAPIEGDFVKPIAATHRKANVTFIAQLFCGSGLSDVEMFAEQVVMLADGATVTAMVTDNLGVLGAARIAARALLGLQLRKISEPV